MLVVDKPPGITSFDVVQAVGRILKERKCGHAGT
ncbi:MAG: tRNA pseudouridine(55) synthase, partial [Deltaproteobacteria bacterium]